MQQLQSMFCCAWSTLAILIGLSSLADTDPPVEARGNRTLRVHYVFLGTILKAQSSRPMLKRRTRRIWSSASRRANNESAIREHEYTTHSVLGEERPTWIESYLSFSILSNAQTSCRRPFFSFHLRQMTAETHPCAPKFAWKSPQSK